MQTYSFGNEKADTVLLQMVDDHDFSVIEQEIQAIREKAGTADFRLIAVKTEDWNRDLSPWEAPAVFGQEGFAGKAEATLAYLQTEVLPALYGKQIFIGGYSLAGLFALWAAYQTDVFSGVAAVSPSVWFPGFATYVEGNKAPACPIYLSLGNKEEKTRNRVMAQVGDAIRSIDAYLRSQHASCVLEWNEGNHFKEPEIRTAQGFAWLMQK